jgi:hypothetical protein
MSRRPSHAPGPAKLTWVFAGVSVALSGALLVAAALVPAPPVVLPLIVLVCLAAPMHAAWRLCESLSVHRAQPAAPFAAPPSYRLSDQRALVELRRFLDQIPETRHPLED